MLRFLRYFILAIPLIIVMSQQTSATEKFKMLCKAQEGIGYRYDTDLNGAPMNEKWTSETGFSSDWLFEYPGTGDDIFIDNKAALGFLSAKTAIAIEYAENNNAQSVWSYAINLQINRVVASQVNTNIFGSASGMKTRSIVLGCKRLK